MQGINLKPQKLSAKYLLLFSILPVVAYHVSLIAFLSFVPIFHLLKEKRANLYIPLYFLPFYLYIYSGIYKSTHSYYGLFFGFSILLVVALALYQILYIFLAVFLFKKTGLNEGFFAVFFVAFEFLKNIFLYGMPLGNLNILTYNLNFFIQDASLFGSMFIDLKILLVNFGFYLLIKKQYVKGALIIAAMFALPFVATTQKPVSTKEVSLAIVQGNIPQNQKWEEKYLQRNLNIYLKLSNGLKTDYVFWPESAYPYLFEKNYAPSIKKLIDNNSFTLIFGAITKNGDNYYNSVIYYSKNKIEIYNKQKLVPFAEIIPFAKLLGLQNDTLTEGKKNVIFKGKINIGPMICYEENFESISRKYKNHNAQLLAVFTNDAWFDKTPTFYLLPRSDIYRSVENRVEIIRVANTGISFAVNPKGKIVYQLKPDKRSVLLKKIEVKIYDPTFYDKVGFLFRWAILFLCITIFIYTAVKQTKP